MVFTFPLPKSMESWIEKSQISPSPVFFWGGIFVSGDLGWDGKGPNSNLG